jgi:integrase
MKARSSDWRVILKSLNTGKTGRIVLKAGSNKLYYDFCYDGKRYEKTTGLQFSVENALQARKTLDDMMGEIQAGTFCFASRFPYASPVSLTLHTQQESRSKAKRPDQITIAEFINGTHDYDGWLKVTLPRFDKKQQSDYERDIRYWLVPLYGHLTFAELTGDKLHSSLSDYKRFKMENGPLLSGIRIKNIFTPLRLILRSASSKYGWRDLEDPFEYLTENNFGPKRKENPTPALLFTEFVKLRMHLNDYDQRITDMKALTGMIDSEMSGLRKTDIFFDAAKPYLHIRNKVVNCIESDELKTEFRERQMHITRRLKKELECFMAQSPDNYVFTKPNGTRYLGEDFRKAWAKAFKAEGMKYIRPYCLRHSFAGWSKIVGIELSWLQDMMGHGSLQMLYKRYGRHKFGLEDDRESIIEFFGMDYLRLGNASAANLFAKDAKDEYQRPREGKKKAA